MPLPRVFTALALGVLLGSAPGPARAATVVLYDGANPSPTQTLDQQGWLYGAQPSPGSSTVTAGSGFTLLDTTPDTSPDLGDHAGFFDTIPPFGQMHPLKPVLDRTAGFTVRLDQRIVSERHSRPERAGFSLIVLGEDLTGIELAFWGTEVWAQPDDFLSHGEGAAYDTTAAITRYELCVLGSTYSLTANGSPLLSGPLRDYSSKPQGCSSFPLPALCPYRWPSLIFLGDDTTSAEAATEIAYLSVTTPLGGSAPAVGNTLLMTHTGPAIAIESTPVLPGTGYHLYRDTSAAGIGTTLFDQGSAPAFADSVSYPDPATYYFSLKTLGDCGAEFP